MIIDSMPNSRLLKFNIEHRWYDLEDTPWGWLICYPTQCDSTTWSDITPTTMGHYGGEYFTAKDSIVI